MAKTLDAEWTEDEARKFRAGLKKMGFERLAPDAQNFCHGTETWSLKLGPVAGKKLKEAARKPRTR